MLDASGCNIWRTLSLATQTFGFKQVVDEARSKYHLFMYQEEEEEEKNTPITLFSELTIHLVKNRALGILLRKYLKARLLL